MESYLQGVVFRRLFCLYCSLCVVSDSDASLLDPDSHSPSFGHSGSSSFLGRYAIALNNITN